MSKNAIIGVAIALCTVAAGVGAFFATRQTAVRISATEPAVSVSSALAQNAGGAQPVTPAGTDGFVVEPAAPQAVAPAAVPAAAASETPALPAGKSGGKTTTPATSTAGRASGSVKTAPPKGDAQVPAAPSGSGVDSSWPTGTATSQPLPTAPAAEPPVAAPVAAPPVETPLPPESQFEELVVSADSVLGLKLDSTVNSETARLEDPVEAHVTRDVRVGSRVAVASGTRVLGSVSQVEPGGRMKTKARLAVRFHTLVLGDGTRAQIQTDAVFREGDSPGQEAASKMGAAAAGGAILGAILGGGKGAAIGGSIGAAGGAAAVMAGKRNAAVLQAGTAVTVRLQQPVGIMVEK